MKEFRARLKLKPELWLGCKLESWAPSLSGRVLILRFSNFPWFVCFDKLSCRILTVRKFGEFYTRPVRESDLLYVGQEFAIAVSTIEQDGRRYIQTRIVL